MVEAAENIVDFQSYRVRRDMQRKVSEAQQGLDGVGMWAGAVPVFVPVPVICVWPMMWVSMTLGAVSTPESA